MGVPAGVDEGDAEGAQAAVLGVALFEVAEAADQLFAGDVGVVGEEVALGGLAGVVDEDVGVGCHAGYRANHVAVTQMLVPVIIVCRCCGDKLIEYVQLLGACVLLEELARDLPLCC